MRMHAERIQGLGAGLLSESNHQLKNDIRDTNEILENVSRGLVMGEGFQDPTAFIDENLMPKVMKYLVKGIKAKYPTISESDMTAHICESFRNSGLVVESVKSESRLNVKKRVISRKRK